jgi:D-amino-acid dehydrogenase
MSRAVVIGGGVIGVTTGAAIARRGLQVTVLERAERLGGGATARNGGQLSYGYADALAAPAIVRDLPGLLAGLDSAFRIRVRLTPQFLDWVGRFLANCTASRFTENTRAVLRLALLSRSALMRLRRLYPDLAFHHGTAGKLHLYDDAAKLQAAATSMELKNLLGCEQRVLSRDETLAIEPAVDERPILCGGHLLPPRRSGRPTCLGSCRRECTRAELSGCHTELLVKLPDEMGAVAKPGAQGNFRHCFLGILQKPFGIAQAGLAQVRGRRLPEFGLKQAC